jgi:hypothetical protein
MPGTTKRRFALCVENAGCDDLEPRKVYPVLPDEAAAREGLVRIVDESGEDYLYPATQFVFLDLPRAAERALAARRDRSALTPARGSAPAPARR